MPKPMVMGHVGAGVIPSIDQAFSILVELYRGGRLNIDDLITRYYPLDEISTAIEDLGRGERARGVFTPAS